MAGSKDEQRHNRPDAEEGSDHRGRWTRVFTSVCRVVSLGPRERKESGGKISDTASATRPPRPPTGVY